MLDKVDVLIIGSGASGAAVAWSLADTKMRILCLEQGDWVKPTDYPTNGRNWEARLFSDFAINPNRRARETDYPINDANSPVKVVNFNGVGGSTIMYTAHYPRLHPSDFRVKTLDGVAEDWPVDYQTLEPYFAENDRMMGVAGLAGDPAYPLHHPPMPPLPLGKSGQRFGKALNSLGWHWWPSDSAIATVEYDGRAPCINLGHCTPGCAQGAKASTDITYWPAAIRAGVELRTRARVREITTDETGMATGAIYYDAEGQEHFQPAEMVIVACNGVGTPRLLLNSVSGRFPNGIANSSGLVGKNLMFHPFALTYGYVDEPLDGNHGPPLNLWSQEFYETDRSRGFVRGYTLQLHRGTGSIVEAITSTAAGRLPWGEDHHKVYRSLLNRRLAMSTITEDLPEEHNRVTLDPVLKDSNGIPAPKIDYTIGENTRKMMEHGIARSKEILTAAGATGFGVEAPIMNGGWHLMGTARMGTDPERSVVNEWGRSHDVKNLFIVDGSIWVTSGGVNPTSTIQALALYIADNIKQRLANATLFD
ncbi:GMC family oxidoreductase [Reyranella aquatilis]|uniref:GMC family oxidoreductase n=1 Tax=Reyranella aquatilis TaxID=2035356 RepID=A0ABS8KMR3_9HYPH|nr:GMC family oxidoreductase [Reyranella aquatilis]MCC8427345.1 GMC family oxidoreductase [Reyranella aquatilis]